jgi:two-component system chemotaxis response regulator CheY
MAKRVLDVGQCSLDHGAIRRLLVGKFGAEVAAAETSDDALRQLRAGPFDLVLVNRKLDVDGSEGLDVLRAIRSDPALAEVPVMLVTNYAEHQAAAVAAGAVPGFGKAELDAPATRQKLAPFLARGAGEVAGHDEEIMG